MILSDPGWVVDLAVGVGLGLLLHDAGKALLQWIKTILP